MGAFPLMAHQRGAARSIEVRSMGHSGVLTLSSSHFDPEQKSSRTARTFLSLLMDHK